MNNYKTTKNQNLRLIAKNGSIHLGLVEEQTASPPTNETIQLELDFNQSTLTITDSNQ